jgi:nucleoside-diphosphate-sugar epimerase
MTATVLLAGGAGYLGSVLAEELLSQNYAVRLLDSLYFGDHGLEGIRDRVELIESDMRALDARVFAGVVAVINVAGVSNDPTAEYDPKTNYELNTTASTAMARAARESGVHRYVLASSCSIYDHVRSAERLDVTLDEESDVDPPGAYAGSKLAAERELLPLATGSFCVSALRMGTLFGFSRRMRYDLVVNTFVKDAFCRGRMAVHCGGEMWRPLVEVRDAARAYVMLLRADAERINGEIFNVVYRNLRISQVALCVRQALEDLGIEVVISHDDTPGAARSYRVAGEKLPRTVGFEPSVSIEESVKNMVASISRSRYDDFSNPRYYNLSWMRLREEALGVC